jgi:Fic family protein
MAQESPPFGFRNLFDDPERLIAAIRRPARQESRNAEYRPWRKFKYVASDSKLDPAAEWFAEKLARHGSWRVLELTQSNGQPFGIVEGGHLLEPLHEIDREMGGGGPATVSSDRGALSDPAHRARIHIRSLMDEAAESSLIEGAATTHKAAIEMLRVRRAPVSKGERMVFNNYAVMQLLKKLISEPLSIRMLIELQGMITADTLNDPGEACRLRRPGENVVVEQVRDGEAIYTPPPAEQLEERLQKLCDFANKSHVGTDFLHPIIKASILHFMIGYEHPFCDGNGRTARAVFYWYALRNRYSIFEFMPISERIRASSSRYTHAYLDTETDDGDLTYFVLYKLDMIAQSLGRLARHLEHEEAKIKRAERLLKLSPHLNLRQRLIIEHALRHPLTKYTRRSHATSNNITLNTAADDLGQLVTMRLMTIGKEGKEIVYHPAPSLRERLAKKGL